MYKKAPPVKNFTKRVRQLVEDLSLHSNNLDVQLEEVERCIRQDLWIPHALNCTCTNKKGMNVFLRVIIWDDDQLNIIRRDGIKAQNVMVETTSATQLSFTVPKILNSSMHEAKYNLLWDLSEYIDGTHFPFNMEIENQLDTQIKHCKLFLNTIDSIATLPKDNFDFESREQFIEHTEIYFKWAYQKKLISKTLLDFLNIKRYFCLDTTAHDDFCICHPDLHVGNAILTNDNRLSVIDWDNTTISDRASMYARHWVIMSHESKWQDYFLKEIEKRNEQFEFWERFIVHVAYRGLDQCHYEMERRERLFETIDDLMAKMPVRAGIVIRMVNAVNKIYNLTQQ